MSAHNWARLAEEAPRVTDVLATCDLTPGDLIGHGSTTFLVESVEPIGEDLYRVTLTADPITPLGRLLQRATVDIPGSFLFDRYGF